MLLVGRLTSDGFGLLSVAGSPPWLVGEGVRPGGSDVGSTTTSVVAGAEAPEQIEAVDVGERLGQRVAVAVAQNDPHALDAELARILDAVAVGVVPDEVADLAGARRVVAEVERRVGIVVADQRGRRRAARCCRAPGSLPALDGEGVRPAGGVTTLT